MAWIVTKLVADCVVKPNNFVDFVDGIANHLICVGLNAWIIAIEIASRLQAIVGGWSVQVDLVGKGYHCVNSLSGGLQGIEP